jgi:NAD(P)-dependent dehydrogenase (short-subunit alcohol dehydrogenase family)
VSRILVTGSADGLGRLAAESLAAAGHDVVVHARRAANLNALVDAGARRMTKGAELLRPR